MREHGFPKFYESGADVAAAFAGSYDMGLVLVSYMVSGFAAYAALSISERVGSAATDRVSWSWLAAGSIVFGVGVWSMHFIGMLAFLLPVQVSYDPSTTFLSVLPAILASAVALHIISLEKPSHRNYIVAGILLGAGIGTMHYTGMAAMRMEAMVLYDPATFVFSIVVAAVFGIVALYVCRLESWGLSGRENSGKLRLLSAALMGFSVAGMHYIAMAAAIFLHPPDANLSYVFISNFWLSLAVTVATVSVMLLAIAATVVDRKMALTSNQLQASRGQMSTLIENISDGFILIDGNGRLAMCNNVFRDIYPSLAELTRIGTPYKGLLEGWAALRGPSPQGASAEDYVTKRLARFTAGSARPENPEEEQLSDGRWMYVREKSVDDGGMIGVWTDVTPLKHLQEVYRQQATHDAMTGLPNRKLFLDRLNQAISHSKRTATSFALLFLDLDGFKRINDTFGHDAGDVVLREVARRLKAVLRESDTVARLGGDEFSIIVEPHCDKSMAQQLSARIIASISDPIVFENGQGTIGASIGIAISDTGNVDAEELVKMADSAMYEAKKTRSST